MAEYLSYKDAVAYMGFKTKDTLYTYIDNGLPVIIVGGSRRISKTAIDEFMKAHTVVAGQDEAAQHD